MDVSVSTFEGGLILSLSEPPPSCNRIFVPAVRKNKSGSDSLFIMKSTQAKVWVEEFRWRLTLLKLAPMECRLFGAYLWDLPRGGDYSNRTKLILDALEGFVYKDDKQIDGAVEFRRRHTKNTKTYLNLMAFVPIENADKAYHYIKDIFHAET